MKIETELPDSPEIRRIIQKMLQKMQINLKTSKDKFLEKHNFAKLT